MTAIKNKTATVPKLRFRGFEGEWEVDKLKNVTHYVDYRGRGPEKSEQGIFLVTAKNIKKGFIDYKCSREYVPISTYNDVMKKGLPQVGDVLFTTEAPLGNIAQVDNSNIALAQRVIKFRAKQNLNNNFLLHFMLNPYYQKEINQKAIGSTVLGISGKDLHRTTINFPSLPEQKKIASFLSAIDKKISQLTQKVSLLEQYKKGLMQQIFSQQIRFKADDGGSFPDWEEKKLGNLTYKVGKKNKENIQYPIYSINNQEGFRPQSEQFEGLDSNDRGYDISLYKIVNKETFAYNPARINVGSIGYSYKLDKVIISSLYVCFKTTKELEDLYLLAYLSTNIFNTYILRYEEGGVRQYLFYDNFSQINIPLPSNQEQKKIANFLSELDAKINQTQAQLEQQQAYKKGLLQQLFV